MEVEDARKEGISSRIRGSSVLKKLKGIKNIQIIVAIFIIAIALIIYSSVMASKEKGSEAVSTVMTSEEQRLSTILSSIDGAGRVEVMISGEDGKIAGVLVIADGADSITVRLRLLDAAATALGVDKRIVNVYSRK